ncbi:MAG: FMN-binding protein [Gammaproteobacteria bacterium]
MIKTPTRGVMLALCLGWGAHHAEVQAEECPPITYKTFITREAFIAEAFGAEQPAVETLTLDSAKQSQLNPVFGRRFPQARLRYWRGADGKTAWIFDDIGKEGYQPTTSGFVVKDGAIERARVIFYKESRGEQVGELSFLSQLLGARANGSALDRSVDNISGATYSVKMMQRMARTALLLDQLASQP